MGKINLLPKDQWPPLIKEINDPPAELWLDGTLPDPKIYTYLTVVGSRRFSAYGGEACRSLIKGLSGQPIVIVSGLALGIDTIAHEAALEASLPTLAIPGSGLNRNVLYPRTNIPLAEKIIATGGGLLSEFEPSFRATKYSFPRRNRLMAGLAPATLIVEAGERSGTLITARLALDYNREVLIVPGGIFNSGAIGPLTLLRDGARPIINSADILEVLDLEESGDLFAAKAVSDNMTPKEKEIHHLISLEPLNRDDLAAKLDWPTNDLNTTLSLLEIKGLIKEIDGNFRAL